MAVRLDRYQEAGGLHFVTFSCAGRKPYLGSPAARDLFEDGLERVRYRYRFEVCGYVVMPEHVHLLVSEPEKDVLAVAIQALKISVSKRLPEKPFWLPRYYDFNVRRGEKRMEKLVYIHANPVKRGLVETPEDWTWSSARYYQTGVQGRVKITVYGRPWSWLHGGEV